MTGTVVLSSAAELTFEEGGEIRRAILMKCKPSKQVAPRFSLPTAVAITIARGEASRDVAYMLRLPSDNRELTPTDRRFLKKSLARAAAKKNAERSKQTRRRAMFMKRVRGRAAAMPRDFADN